MLDAPRGQKRITKRAIVSSSTFTPPVARLPHDNLTPRFSLDISHPRLLPNNGDSLALGNGHRRKIVGYHTLSEDRSTGERRRLPS